MKAKSIRFLRKKIYYHGLILLKNIYQFFKNSEDSKQIAFILGCQRSGTTLMEEIFQKDFNTKIYLNLVFYLILMTTKKLD